MSNALQTKELLAGVVEAVRAAWGDGAIVLGEPVTPLSPPYRVLRWDEVTVSFTGLGASVQRPAQRNVFTIIGRWPTPEQPIELARVDRANELIARLQAGPDFAGIAILPLVTSVGRGKEELGSGAYQVVVRFEAVTLADHH